MRLPRPRIENCCVHVTHRCQERRFLLGTDIDRKQYVRRLREASQRFPAVRVLDYVVTSNHVHLLVWVPRLPDLSAMMAWLAGTFAGDRNRRTGREGALWRGRFHPTLVETGSHLSRCLFYLDMNMVRAGVVAHPRDWEFGGYQELSGTRQRYRIIDQRRLFACLAMPDAATFRPWHEATLADLCRRPQPIREPHWSRALAVGGREWLGRLAAPVPEAERYIRPATDHSTEADDAVCVLNPPPSLRLRLWQAITDRTRP